MLTDLLDDILHKRRLTPLFQPIVHLGNSSVYGYEALIRGPSDGPLHSPVALFEVAERAGRLVDLDILCRELHIRAFAQLQLPGRLFLNINPASLRQSGFPPGVTKRFLRQQGLSPDRLVIELTEQSPIVDYEGVREAVTHYREMGFSVAIDDLGAGYSGLRLWSELRPDFVKLDRHFIEGIHEDEGKRQFVYSIQEIARSLDCLLVAEGVESANELQIVKSLGVEFAQGHRFGRPTATPRADLPRSLFFCNGSGPTLGVRTETIANLVRFVPTIQPEANFNEVGDLFAAWPQVTAMPVVTGGRPVGILRRYDFMNIFASRYGRDLYGREAIHSFMDPYPLVIEKELPVEKVSRLITDQEQIQRDDFIITDAGRYVGVGTLIDLLRRITELQVRNARYANPLTLLPGNVPINEYLERLLQERIPFAACYCDLDHFKAYNDCYGYGRGDVVIRTLATLLTESIDPTIDFVGHIGGDDFMLVLRSKNWQPICAAILERFANKTESFYSEEHRRAAGMWGEDRCGNRLFHPLLSLSIGAICPADGGEETCHDIAAKASEAKRMAKREAGNSFFVDRRNAGGEWRTSEVLSLAGNRIERHERPPLRY